MVLKALMKENTRRLLDLTANALKLAFFRRVVPASGLEDFHFHDLRHEAISRLAESGKFQLIELQAISGRRDGRVLQRYAHLCAGSLAEKMYIVSGEHDTYIDRGRRRRRGGKSGAGASESRCVAKAPADPVAVSLVAQVTGKERGLSQRSNVIAFPSRRVA